jgi:hypothetical protein
MKYSEIIRYSGPHPRNGNLSWCPSDTEELFLNNIKKNPGDPTLIYYKDNPIDYYFNNFGFRTPDDFNTTDWGNVFLGCSMTFGIGHHLGNTWSYKLNQLVGGKFWNLSSGGTGIMTSSRLLFGFKDFLRIKNVFHFKSKFMRYEFLRDDRIFDCNTWATTDPFFVENLFTDNHVNMTYDIHSLAIKKMCEMIGCNYYCIDTVDFSIDLNQTENKIGARDLIHPSIQWNDYLKDRFYNKFILGEKD